MRAQFNKEKAAQMSISKRVAAGKCLTAFEATIYFSAHTALSIATAYFLWFGVESGQAGMGQTCNDSYTVSTLSDGTNYPVVNPNCTNTVDVAARWNTILRLYFAFFIIQWFRFFIIFIVLCT